MALTAQSLLTYGIEVTSLNNVLPFRAVAAEPIRYAILALGFYSPTSIAVEVIRAMQSLDSVNVYTVTVNRNLMGGTQNRLTISTTGTYLELDFASAVNPSVVVAPLIGFNIADYTGATSYTGSFSTGTGLIPEFIGYTYLDDFAQGKLFGAVNVSAAGLKEAVVFNFQNFIDVEFKYEREARLPEWKLFWNWAIQQRPFDFIPEINHPEVNYQVTLEKTSNDGKGLGFKMKEQLPNFPFFYTTGAITFRIIAPISSFLTV